MFFRHVRKYLSAFSQGELSSDQASRISEHLLTCERCRAEHEEIQWGIRLAQRLPTLSAPPELTNALEDALRSRGPARVVRSRRVIGLRWPVAISVSLAGAAVMILFWYQRIRPLVSVRPARPVISRLETLALDLHLRQKKGTAELDFRTHDLDALRVWVAEESDLDLPLATHQPADEVAKYELQGAKILKNTDGDIVSVFYQVDRVPVTLIAASVRSLGKAEAPSEGLWQKKIYHRSVSGTGTNLLSWTRDEQSYVLASDLPGLGQQACFVCHTNPKRREIIRNAKLRQ